MRTGTQVRVLGWLQVVIGLLIAGFVGAIALDVAPSFLQPGARQADGSAFTGTKEQGLLTLAGFGVVIVFGVTTTAAGLWQVATGERNKWILYSLIVLLVLIFFVGAALMYALGG